MSNLNDLTQAVSGGRTKLVPELTQAALADGNKAEEILNVMIGAMGEVGEKFTNGDIFVPEMLAAAKAMQKGLEILKPALADTGAVRESGLSGFKIIAGRAPITEAFATEIGADGYADDAAGAAVLTSELSA